MQIADKYSPQEIESKWYDYWIEKRLFHSEPDQREPYTIVIPPPNVTGMLHMGHMLNNTLQDVLVRRARMSGQERLLGAGAWTTRRSPPRPRSWRCSHAKGHRKDRRSRAKSSSKYAWEWKEKYGGMILKQLRKLGASCDWERTLLHDGRAAQPRASSKSSCDLYRQRAGFTAACGW